MISERGQWNVHQLSLYRQFDWLGESDQLTEGEFRELVVIKGAGRNHSLLDVHEGSWYWVALVRDVLFSQKWPGRLKFDGVKLKKKIHTQYVYSPETKVDFLFTSNGPWRASWFPNSGSLLCTSNRLTTLFVSDDHWRVYDLKLTPIVCLFYKYIYLFMFTCHETKGNLDRSLSLYFFQVIFTVKIEV